MKNDEITKIFLAEMFRVVGMDYTYDEILEYGKQDDWYYMRTWTYEQEGRFKLWMNSELKKRTRWPEKMRKREIGMFLLMWGWKVEEGS